MNKEEFLNILRNSLSGEVTNEIIEQNVRYYDGYISAQTLEEEVEIIDRLGDPRLIAKTIIEAEKAAKEKSMNNWSRTTSYQSHTSEAEEQYRDNSAEHGKHVFYTNMQWYHKLIAILVIVVLFVVIALIGRLVIGFLFAFGLPILLIILIMSLFRKR